ncbi:MAG: AAA family ATPase [Clostridia bacterium]|nr:AAA family ATPase [Clostridia bacterium]
MKILKLHIISFGMIEDKTIPLGDGLNVIEGDNETGKSTVAAFIRFIFYGLDKAGREKYVGWGKPGCSGTVTLQAEDRIYRIERELLINRPKDKISIVSDTESVRTDKAPWELFIGVPEDVFVNTAFTGDPGSTVGGQGLPEAIENIIFSADEAVSTKKALKRIDDGRVALYYKNRKGGKIHELENQVSELEYRLNAAKSSAEQIFSLDDSIRTRKARLESNKAKIEKINMQLEDYDTYKRMRVLEEYKQNEKLLEKSNESLSELEEKYGSGGFLPDRNFYDGLRTLEARAAEMRERSAQASAKLAEAELAMKGSESAGVLRIASGIGGVGALKNMYEGLDGKIFSYKKRAAVFFVLSVPFIAASAGLFFLKLIPYAAGCAAIALLFIILGIVNASKSSKLNKGLDKLAAKLGADSPSEIPELLDTVTNAEAVSAKKAAAYNEALEEKRETDEKAAELDDKIRTFSSRYKEVGTSGLGALITETDGILNELSNAHKQIEMAQYRTRISSENLSGQSMEELRASLHGSLKPDELAGFKYDERRTELNLLLRQNESIADKIGTEEKNFAAANATFTLPATIYAKLQNARSELEEAKENYEAYALAYEKLNEASIQLRNSISPTLASDAGRLMNDFTAGKYDALGISNKLEITYSGGGMTHPASTMSTGTQDIAYVCLRLALINMIFPKKVPAFFDDTFARVDDTRAQNVIEALSRIDQQTVIFTCRGREGELASRAGGRIIKL